MVLAGAFIQYSLADRWRAFLSVGPGGQGHAISSDAALHRGFSAFIMAVVHLSATDQGSDPDDRGDKKNRRGGCHGAFRSSGSGVFWPRGPRCATTLGRFL